jgi:hypothetical protein
MKSQLSADTGAESRSNTTTTGHRFVHPDAKELLYFDIKFSSVARMYFPPFSDHQDLYCIDQNAR